MSAALHFELNLKCGDAELITCNLPEHCQRICNDINSDYCNIC